MKLDGRRNKCTGGYLFGQDSEATTENDQECDGDHNHFEHSARA